MSRFDYPDPGTDPAYCDGLSVNPDDEREDEMTNELVLVDLSSIAHPIWHMSQSEPDPNHTSQAIVARVRALASTHPHAAICCDSGKSFRHEISTAYKANRPESDAPLQHQIKLARTALEADGFPVWAVRGFEADDVIATAVDKALALGLTVLIVSADKDLLQLVGLGVRAMSVRDGSILDEAAVVAKFSVKPSQMRDYLTLVGDSSDNVKGAAGIGPKKASDLLAKYGSLDGVYEALTFHGSEFKPAMATSLREFKPRLDETRSLITLRTDVELPFDEISAERVSKAVAEFVTFDTEGDEMRYEEDATIRITEAPLAGPAVKPSDASVPASIEAVATAIDGHQPSVPNGGRIGTSLAVREVEAEILPAPAQWERQLDPRSMKDARTLAQDMFQSHMFSAYGSPQAVLSTVMLGRELGLPAMAALRSVHVIEGKHSLGAALMVALVLKSGLADYFEPISVTDKEATYETQRKGRKPIRLTHTIEMAVTAKLVKPGSNWEKIPTDMLVARVSARLARMVYPDLLAGLYTPDELTDMRDSAKAA